MDPSALERNTTIVTCVNCDEICLPWQVSHINKLEDPITKKRSGILYCGKCRTTNCLKYEENKKVAKELFQQIKDNIEENKKKPDGVTFSKIEGDNDHILITSTKNGISNSVKLLVFSEEEIKHAYKIMDEMRQKGEL